MRTESQIKERIELAVIEAIQGNLLSSKEPENYIPQFVSLLTERVNEIVLDEIMMRKRF